MPNDIKPEYAVFYYSEQAQKDQFLPTAPGTFHVARALKNMTSWQQLASDASYRLKTIILSDPSLMLRVDCEPMKIYETMFAFGYKTIWVWSNKKLVPCTHPFEVEAAVANIVPSPDEEIMEAALKQNFSADEFINLDYLRLSSLLFRLMSMLSMSPQLSALGRLGINHVSPAELRGMDKNLLQAFLESLLGRQFQGLCFTDDIKKYDSHTRFVCQEIFKLCPRLCYLTIEGSGFELVDELYTENPELFSACENLIVKDIDDKKKFLSFFQKLTGRKWQVATTETKAVDTYPTCLEVLTFLKIVKIILIFSTMYLITQKSVIFTIGK